MESFHHLTHTLGCSGHCYHLAQDGWVSTFPSCTCTGIGLYSHYLFFFFIYLPATVLVLYNKYLRQVSIKVLCVRVSVCAHVNMCISTDINGAYLKVSLLTFHINLYLHRMMSVSPFQKTVGLKTERWTPAAPVGKRKKPV